MTVIPIVIRVLGIVTKRLVQELDDLEIKKTSGDRSNYSIVEIGPNTKKSPGDMWSLSQMFPLCKQCDRITHQCK